ncbi:hypothetical protein [Hydrogenispora ethanolica]|nr:hypothetical protein [Hydrogenispora ethanolica]
MRDKERNRRSLPPAWRTVRRMVRPLPPEWQPVRQAGSKTKPVRQILRTG